MRLNQATDYAFRMVLYLASLPAGTKMTGAALAEKQNIPERFLLKIMRSLTAAHIMKSYRGVEGGFALQREPKDITLFDVIEAVEGQTELQRCLLRVAVVCVLFMQRLPVFSVIWLNSCNPLILRIWQNRKKI